VNNDPIADMLSRIRNAILRRQDTVQMPGSNMKLEIAKILKTEGFIRSFLKESQGQKTTLKVELKYMDGQRCVIQGLERVSKSGRRVYVGNDEIPRVKGGVGIAILTTPRGLMTDQEARQQKIGGEVLCRVW
jgi:small subunit ribosomal protein S8